MTGSIYKFRGEFSNKSTDSKTKKMLRMREHNTAILRELAKQEKNKTVPVGRVGTITEREAQRKYPLEKVKSSALALSKSAPKQRDLRSRGA